MKLRYKIVNTILAILAIGTITLGLLMSHNSPCGSAPVVPAGTETMQAITYRCYGSAEVLKLESVPKPVPADDEVLVKVVAASVNPLDWHYMRGSPYLVRLGSGLGAPDDPAIGVDFAGVVEAVGKSVTRFEPGDEVFGGRSGAFAEYLTIREQRPLAHKPSNMTFEQAAAVPIAAITALQALRDTAQVKAGQKVLINGASGGVGTFAVQIAKSYGAEVTGICSTRNVAMVRSIGADHVIDYTKEDYTNSGNRYDVIIDMVGNHTLSENRAALMPEGRFVIVGGGKGNWLGPMISPLKAVMLSPFVDQEFGMMLAELRQDDLEYLAGLMESGKLTPVLDGNQYRLEDVPAAISYSEEGHARGKIVVTIE